MSSRYDTRYRGRKLPKQSRTIPLPASSERGNGLDAGRYFRCWHCGYICNIDRDSLGGAQSQSGVALQEYEPESDTGVFNVPVFGGLDSAYVVPEAGADGAAKEIRRSIEPIVSGGCPFCGSLNWKGDF